MKKILIICFSSFILFGIAPSVFAADTGIAQLADCSGTDCSACNVVYLANGAIKWLIGILFVVFALLLAIAGVRLVTSGGNHHALDEAKSSFTNAIIGFLIILSAWLIVDTIMRALVGTEDKPGQLVASGTASGYLFWSQVQCQTQTEAGYTDFEQDEVRVIEVERLSLSCSDPSTSIADISRAGCIVTPCTTTNCLTSCNNLKKGSDLGYDNNNDYCVNTPAGVVGGGGPLITQPSGQLCFGGGVCLPAVTGIAGQINYQYPSGYGSIPSRWIDTLSVNMGTRVSQNYTLGELNVSGTCGNGGRYMYVDPNALAALERINQKVGRKLSLNSVHRSPGCNTRVGGAASSYHMSGKAFDIQPGGISKATLMQMCRDEGARYVSDYESTSHVHCDWGGR